MLLESWGGIESTERWWAACKPPWLEDQGCLPQEGCPEGWKGRAGSAGWEQRPWRDQREGASKSWPSRESDLRSFRNFNVLRLFLPKKAQ